MRIGTTPVHVFTIPFQVELIDEVLIVYKQNGQEVLRKETADCGLEGYMISVPLSQDDTLSFEYGSNVHIQLRVLTTEGVAFSSRVYVVSAKECLSDNEVI